MDKKRYTVTSKPSRDGRGPDYIIYDNLLGAEVGFFDTEKWAESIAEVMNEEWKEKMKNGKHGYTVQNQCFTEDGKNNI